MARGSVRKHDCGWGYRIDLGPDPATGKRRQASRQGLRRRLASTRRSCPSDCDTPRSASRSTCTHMSRPRSLEMPQTSSHRAFSVMEATTGMTVGGCRYANSLAHPLLPTARRRGTSRPSDRLRRLVVAEAGRRGSGGARRRGRRSASVVLGRRQVGSDAPPISVARRSW